MTDQNIKKISKLLDDRLKLIHAEIARMNKEVSELRSAYIGTRSELSRISKDTARIDSSLDNINATLNEHTDKIDALLADVCD